MMGPKCVIILNHDKKMDFLRNCYLYFCEQALRVRAAFQHCFVELLFSLLVIFGNFVFCFLKFAVFIFYFFWMYYYLPFIQFLFVCQIWMSGSLCGLLVLLPTLIWGVFTHQLSPHMNSAATISPHNRDIMCEGSQCPFFFIPLHTPVINWTCYCSKRTCSLVSLPQRKM